MHTDTAYYAVTHIRNGTVEGLNLFFGEAPAVAYDAAAYALGLVEKVGGTMDEIVLLIPGIGPNESSKWIWYWLGGKEDPADIPSLPETVTIFDESFGGVSIVTSWLEKEMQTRYGSGAQAFLIANHPVGNKEMIKAALAAGVATVMIQS